MLNREYQMKNEGDVPNHSHGAAGSRSWRERAADDEAWEREHAAEWERVDRKLRGIAARRAQLDAEEAHLLRYAEELKLWRAFGFGSLVEYMERALGYAPHTAIDRIRVARVIAELPLIAEALEDGALARSAVRELSRVAVPETESVWLEAARGKTLREIEAMVSGHRPGDLPTDKTEPRLHRKTITIEVSPETYDMWRMAHKLTAEDPSLAIAQDGQTQDTVLRGLGELHLRSVLERLRGDLGVDVETRAPRIPYRETVTRAADGHCRHKKQTGGAGQFGEVHLNIEPLERGAGFEFVDETVGGSIPGQYIPAVEKGVREVLRQGAVSGNPMQDVRVVVYDGKHHPVDSKEVAFVAAGRRAFMDAFLKARPIVLEPIARIEVTTPAQHVGDITGHLSGIRGRIAGSSAHSGNRVTIQAQVPLAELGDYQTTLKSLTGGAGVFTMEFERYEPAPPSVQKELERSFRPKSEE